MESEVKPFGCGRNWDYIKANFLILWKKVTEYKANFLILGIEHFLYFMSFLLIYRIIFSFFFDVLNWQLVDYILFFVLMDWILAFGGIFFWRWPFLNSLMKTGNFNIFLIRPIPLFLGYFFSNLSNGLVVYAILNPIMHIMFLLLFFDFQIYNIALGILIWFIVLICFVLNYEFLHSFEFVKLGLSISFIRHLNEVNYSLCNSYPYQFFSKFQYKEFLFLLSPLFFIGSLLIPILRGYEVWNLTFQLSMLVFLIIIFSIGIIINWHYGLKKYEAFG